MRTIMLPCEVADIDRDCRDCENFYQGLDDLDEQKYDWCPIFDEKIEQYKLCKQCIESEIK
jgi:hypothetical protein